MPLGGGFGIKTNCEVRGLLFVDELYQCVGESELSIGILAGGADAGTTDQGIISPKDQCEGVEEKDPFIHPSNVQTRGAERGLFFPFFEEILQGDQVVAQLRRFHEIHVLRRLLHAFFQPPGLFL